MFTSTLLAQKKQGCKRQNVRAVEGELNTGFQLRQSEQAGRVFYTSTRQPAQPCANIYLFSTEPTAANNIQKSNINLRSI